MQLRFLWSAIMASINFPRSEWWDWALGVQFAPISVPPNSPFPWVCTQVPSSLSPRTESHCFFVWGRPLLHHPRGYRPDDADNPPGICVPFQPRNPHWALSKDDFPAESSDSWAFPPHFRSAPVHKSPVPFFSIFHQRKLDYFLPVCPAWVLFR